MPTKIFDIVGILKVMQKPKAIIFDIDGTLSPEISWTALTEKLGGSVEAHLQIYQDYKAGTADYTAAKRSLLELWRLTGKANKAFFTEVFQTLQLQHEALSVLATLSSEYDTCIITGSMDVYAEMVARKLRIANWYANTTLHWDESGELVDMDYRLDQAERKGEQLLEFCQARTYDPHDTVIIGDGDNDVQLFKLSGQGVAVGVDIPKDLVAVAWKTIDTLGGLPALLNEEFPK